MKETRIHPETGKELHREEREQEIRLGQLSVRVNVPGWYPDDESDSLHSGADLKASNEAYKELRVQLAGRIKSIRKKSALTQEEAGLLIGGGKRAFQKYERGQVPSAAALNLIEVIREHPAVVETLRKLHEKASIVPKKNVFTLGRSAASGRFSTRGAAPAKRSSPKRKPVRKGA